MEHTLIYTIIASIVTAFVFGMVAKQLNLPTIFGYIIAGVAIGPNTPGFVADLSLANQLAEIGITLLMFGVGLHFSLRDLVESRHIALPGAMIQIVLATAIGGLVGVMLGYDLQASLIYGLALSVASTIVLIRSLEQQGTLDSAGGKIAVSWLIVEDVAMVLALVILPVIAQIEADDEAMSLSVIITTLLSVIFKVGGFIAFMVIVGRRFLPWLLDKISQIGSDELNTLGVLAIALGFALMAYVVFDASLALGAFLAGVMLNESEIGRKSGEYSRQMRDVFSVLFFVSVGMLFDPRTLLSNHFAVLLTLAVIIGAKGAIGAVITRWFGQPREVCYTVGIGLAQIGEFSFILGNVAYSKGLIDEALYNLILAGALFSIVANPFLFKFFAKPRRLR